MISANLRMIKQLSKFAGPFHNITTCVCKMAERLIWLLWYVYARRTLNVTSQNFGLMGTQDEKSD